MRFRIPVSLTALAACTSLVVTACAGAPAPAPAATQAAAAAPTAVAAAPTAVAAAPTVAAQAAPTVAAAATSVARAAPTVAAQVAPTVAAVATSVAAAAPTRAPAATAAPAAAPTPAATTAAAAPSGKKLKVGLVTDVGKIDDKSFNQSAWEGVQQAGKQLGADVKFIETTDPKDYGKNIEQFAQDNYDVIVTVGFALGQATVDEAKKYPDIKFIGVDQFQQDTVPNVAGLVFNEDRAGYLAGALAAQMTKTGTIGQVLGTPIVPPVEAFGVGYINGAKALKSDIHVLSACHPGGLAKGFSDPDWGKATAVQMMDQKADIIFAAGGQTGNGGLLAIAERKDSGVLGIGVDTDQYYTLQQADPILLSSAMKLITPGVFDLIKAAQDGSFKGGNTYGKVGLAPYHDLDSKVPDAVKQKMQQLSADVTSGKVNTGWSGKPTGQCPASV